MAILSSFGANMAGPLSSLAVAPFLAHGLGPQGRGLVAAATVPFLLLSAALTLGMPEALTYAIGRSRLKPGEAFAAARWVLFLCSVFTATVMWILTPALSGGSDTVAMLIRLSCVIFIPTQMLWAYRGRAQGLQDWRRLNYEKVTTALFRFAAIAFVYLTAALNIESASLILVTAPAIGLIAYLPFKRKPVDPTVTRGSYAAARYLLGFGSKVWLGSIAGILLSRLDQILIAPLSSVAQLGFYAVAVNVGDTVLFATAAVSSVLLARESKDPTDQRVAACSSLLFMTLIAVIVPVCLSANWWMGVIFGESFKPSSSAAIVLLIASALACPGSIAGVALTARGMPHSRSLSIFVGLTVNVAMIFTLVPSMGALGAAIATLGGLAANTAVNLAYLKRHFNINPVTMFVPTRMVYRRVLGI